MEKSDHDALLRIEVLKMCFLHYSKVVVFACPQLRDRMISTKGIALLSVGGGAESQRLSISCRPVYPAENCSLL